LSENHEVRAAVSRQAEHQYEQFRTLLAIGQERGEFRRDSSDVQLGRFFGRMLYGLGIMAFLHEAVPRRQSAHAVVTLLLDALLPAERRATVPHEQRAATRRKRTSARSRGAPRKKR
jgi:hypothetical protein